MRIWGTSGTQATRLVRSPIASETLLETLLASDPSILGERLIVIGRQVETRGGNGVVDLLAIDRFGAIWVIELKKGAATRTVTSQLIGYGCWVITLSRTEAISIFEYYTKGASLEDAFCEQFRDPLPAEVPAAHRLVLVAASVNGPAQNELLYLGTYDRPVNLLRYEHFTDGGAAHLIKVWSANRHATELPSARTDHSVYQPPTDDAPLSAALLNGARSFPIKRHHYDDTIRDPHAQVQELWDKIAPDSAWNFIPPSFPWALYEHWIREQNAVKPYRTPLSAEMFHQRLRVVAVASGEWEYKQACAPIHMTADEPLMELVPDWKRPTDRAGTWGYRRVHPR